jgi:hypothetical protein
VELVGHYVANELLEPDLRWLPPQALHSSQAALEGWAVASGWERVGGIGLGRMDGGIGMGWIGGGVGVGKPRDGVGMGRIGGGVWWEGLAATSG